MNYFVTIDLLGLRNAQRCTLQQNGVEVEGIFIPTEENEINVNGGKDGMPHAVLALSAKELPESYRSKCEGNAPSHGLEQRMPKAQEMELFGEYQTKLPEMHPEWRGVKPSECEEFRKAIFAEIRKLRKMVGKMYGN